MRVLLLLASSAIAACAVEGVEEARVDEGEVVTTAVDALAATPPEHRAVTAAVETRLGPSVGPGRRVASIRTMKLAGTRARLVVDVDTLASSVVDEASLLAGSSAGHFADSPYARSLAETADEALDAVDADAPVPAGASEPFTLTVDMCQSSRPFERRLFDWAAKLADQVGRPTPVGVAMTGGWAKKHGDELDAILDLERRGKIAITWINHSSTHPLHCQNASCSQAQFLTAPGVDFGEEVLGLERALLSRSLVPSPLFRFPGLVHDARRLGELSRLSLMALDANAWIAKGQPIAPRALVLVHGNGNEPEGITGFLKQVESPARAAALASGKSVVVSPLLVAPVPPR